MDGRNSLSAGVLDLCAVCFGLKVVDGDADCDDLVLEFDISAPVLLEHQIRIPQDLPGLPGRIRDKPGAMFVNRGSEINFHARDD
jgi:hypothetical protein